METEIKNAIKTLAKRAGDDKMSVNSQQNAQAVLSLSHALVALRDVKGDK